MSEYRIERKRDALSYKLGGTADEIIVTHGGEVVHQEFYDYRRASEIEYAIAEVIADANRRLAEARKETT